MKKWRLQDRQQPVLPGIFGGSRARRLPTPREQSLETARNRLPIVIMLFALAWFTISGRLAYLTLHGDTQDMQASHAAPSDGPTERADITDRNGVVLATSLPTVSLCANSKFITDPATVEKQLLSVLPDLDTQKLHESLSDGKRSIIKRHLTPRQYYEVNKMGIAGLEFSPDERRVYPAGNLTAHVVGYTDVDNNGLAGIEKSMDDRLNEDPKPLAISMDLRIQTIMRQELASAMSDYHAEAATGLVMDIRTGEILSMISLPDFEPSHAGTASDDQRFNRATMGVYEMGSTFKIFNTALALDSGLIHIGDVFDTTHGLEIGSHKIRDFEKEDRNLNVAEIFTHSSNIGSAHMAEIFGGTRQRAFFTRLGLTEKTSLEIPEIGAPILPSARNWSDATTMTAAFGHGVAVNAVQLTGAIATIVNDGYSVHPTLMKLDAPPDENNAPVVSTNTSALMRGLMRLVVTHGTAKKADVEGYMVGGKTGTADKLVNGHYVDNQRLSSFVGVFPIDKPKYLVFALLDNPKGNASTHGLATAGWIAAPVVNHVISQIGPLLGLAPLPKDREEEAERKIIKPLGSEMVDGIPVADEGSHYASVETNTMR